MTNREILTSTTDYSSRLQRITKSLESEKFNIKKELEEFKNRDFSDNNTIKSVKKELAEIKSFNS